MKAKRTRKSERKEVVRASKIFSMCKNNIFTIGFYFQKVGRLMKKIGPLRWLHPLRPIFFMRA